MRGRQRQRPVELRRMRQGLRAAGLLRGCGRACVDTKTDVANCGACGAACKSGEACGERNVGNESSFLCMRLCLVAADCKVEGSFCENFPFSGAKPCTISCNPVTQTGCSADTKCAPTGTQGEPCTPRGNSCGPGYSCAAEHTASGIIHCCAKYCTNSCPTGTTCDGQRQLTNGTTSYGACFPSREGRRRRVTGTCRSTARRQTSARRRRARAPAA